MKATARTARAPRVVERPAARSDDARTLRIAELRMRTSAPAATPEDLGRWAVFALADEIEKRELTECENARLRTRLDRVYRINPVMMRNIMASE